MAGPAGPATTRNGLTIRSRLLISILCRVFFRPERFGVVRQRRDGDHSVTGRQAVATLRHEAGFVDPQSDWPNRQQAEDRGRERLGFCL